MASVASVEKPFMALEIVLQHIKDISGTVMLPGSKSLSNRILLLAALSEVVAGKLYYLSLWVIDRGREKIYDANFMVKLWINSQQLQEFKHAHHVSSFMKASKVGDIIRKI
ncbi:unnamed protein product [Fraxinus pennsylvanica]|uniref:Cysteine proteinase inhibitor n=1 Tax=Fraxinus pennsylvanica TaxID=56036 RepID=A0AAD2ACX0_9LAMI|nr:unnamed protein product [Fraxinus pennsylvanica]